jgi:hypothetical protein
MDTIESYHSDMDICSQILCMHIDFFISVVLQDKNAGTKQMFA